MTHPGSAGHGTSAPDSCSMQWEVDGTSAFGTAARATFFVLLEQSGPWGRNAARESHLDPDLGTELDARCATAGGRLMLIRRPGAHADHDGPRHVLVAWAGRRADHAWLLAGAVPAPADLLRLDWSALANGDRGSVRASLPGAADSPPQLLVCTNGRRDVCCAVRGRPLAAAAAQLAPDRVWEVSHTGGHRFAPTAVLLPWGQTLARLDEALTGEVLATSDTGHLPPALLGQLHDRGRSVLSPAEQCAESHVRALVGETRLGALQALPSRDEAGQTSVDVVHEDGRRWGVRVERRPSGRQRPESCGKPPIDVLTYVAEVTGAPEVPARH